MSPAPRSHSPSNVVYRATSFCGWSVPTPAETRSSIVGLKDDAGANSPPRASGDRMTATASANRTWNLRLGGLAATAAIAVSVIYLPQSMLTDLATSLGVPASVASIAATAVQVGYA